MDTKQAGNKWVAFLLLTIGAGIMFKVPYFKTVYYNPLIAALGVTNAQLGSLVSVYALIKTFLYIPGGILADKFDARKMLTVSMVGLGLLTFWYAALPDLATLRIIHILFGVSNVVFWVSFVKAVRLLGTDDQQGRLFGYSEGIRALAGTAVTFAGLWILDIFASTHLAVSYALIFYAVVYTLLGVAIWLVYPKELAESDAEKAKNIGLKDYLNVLRVPGVWLVAMLVFFAYSVQCIAEYTTPYLTNIFGMTAVIAGIIATIRSYMIGVVSSPIVGKIADSIGSPSKAVCGLLVLEILICGVLYIIPGNPAMLMVAVSTVLIFSVMMFGLRGIYYATMYEARVPVALTGTATGIISVLGYLPDTFISPLCGSLIDRYPGIQSFQYMFLLMIGFAVAGLVVSLYIYLNARHHKKAAAAAAQA